MRSSRWPVGPRFRFLSALAASSPSAARGILGGFVALAVLALPSMARAATYQVGPGKTYPEISAVAKLLKPGDVVEVQGDHTYAPVELAQDGTQAAPITLRGIRVNGKRPLISGGDNTVLITGAFTTLEGFEVTSGQQTCIVHRAHGTVLRDDVVHACPRHGILGTDSDSGSLLMEYVEVYDAGSERSGEALKHAVYIATDEATHPGSIFRMQHCYVHDTNGGNSVKSRAERSEIYSNWLEGAQYYELELIGPDDSSGDRVTAPREDADVVGNVFFQTKSVSYVVRIGGDGTGRTGGRYRFVNNTFVHGADPSNSGSIRFSYALDSVELYNNVFYSPSRPIDYLFRETELTWVTSRQIVGSNNWISDGAQNIPTTLKDSIMGASPGFVDLAKRDVRLAAGSPLIDKGTAITSRTDAFAFPRPLARASFTPPLRVLASVGKASARAEVGIIDIGAFELGSPTEQPGIPGSEPPPVPGAPGLPAPGTSPPANGATPSGGTTEGSGCSCSSVGDASASGSSLGGLGAFGGALVLGLGRIARFTRRKRETPKR